MSGSDIKVGVALGAGFFRGLAHIGALQVLLENDIPIHMMAGTSMGAVVGAAYATGMDMYRMEQLTYACNERMFYDVKRSKQGFIKGEKATSFLKTITGGKDFDKAEIPFAAVACDIETGEKVVLNQGKIYEAARASISVPGFFVPAQQDGRTLVDGGVLERVPSSVVREMGADVVIAVDVGARDGRVEVKTTLQIVLRMLELMQYAIVSHDDSADVIIAPNVRHIDFMSMSQSEECVGLGRTAAEEMMPAIKEAIRKAAEM